MSFLASVAATAALAAPPHTETLREPSESMAPTIPIGGRSRPQLADVRFIKRIVGLPGDRLSMRHGKQVREPYRSECEGIGCEFPRTIAVPKGQYFVLGDNRGASGDSRCWGPVRREALLAHVDRCMPQPKIGCPRGR